MGHFRFQLKDFGFPLNRGTVLPIRHHVVSCAEPLCSFAAHAVQRCAFPRISTSRICWKYFPASYCPMQKRSALLLEALSSVAFSSAKALSTFAGNALQLRISPRNCFEPAGSASIIALSDAKPFRTFAANASIIALSDAKSPRTFAGNALQWRILLWRSASHSMEMLGRTSGFNRGLWNPARRGQESRFRVEAAVTPTARSCRASAAWRLFDASRSRAGGIGDRWVEPHRKLAGTALRRRAT